MGYKRAKETMKKLASALSVLALLATMTFGLSSCQQQNQPNQPSQPSQPSQTQNDEPTIVGEWKVLYIDLGGDQYPGQGMSFTFLENGTFLLSMEDGLEKGSYTLAGKNLIMESEGGIVKFTIKELTKDSLVLISSGDGSIEYVCKRVS